MERITITINTTNDAFGDIPELANYELARIINGLAKDLIDGREPEKLLDINGNKVGKVVYE